MVAAVVPLSAHTFEDQLLRGLQRGIGTLLGIALAALLLLLPLSVGQAVLAVVVLRALTELCVPRNYGLAMLTVTPMALLVVALSSTLSPAFLLVGRMEETILGLAMGLVLVAVTSETGGALRRSRGPR